MEDYWFASACVQWFAFVGVCGVFRASCGGAFALWCLRRVRVWVARLGGCVWWCGRAVSPDVLATPAQHLDTTPAPPRYRTEMAVLCGNRWVSAVGTGTGSALRSNVLAAGFVGNGGSVVSSSEPGQSSAWMACRPVGSGPGALVGWSAVDPSRLLATIEAARVVPGPVGASRGTVVGRVPVDAGHALCCATRPWQASQQGVGGRVRLRAAERLRLPDRDTPNPCGHPERDRPRYSPQR